MSVINRDNYEEFIVDYYDGNLNSLYEEILMEFLDDNPELKREFKEFGEMMSTPEIITSSPIFLEKESLLRDNLYLENEESNFNELCIANIEGDLSENEKQLFEEMIEDDDAMSREFNYFSLTKVTADSSIIFTNKDKIHKKSQRQLTLYYSSMAAAASIVLFFGIRLFTSEPSITPNYIADNNKITTIVALDNNNNIKPIENKALELSVKKSIKSKTIDVAKETKSNKRTKLSGLVTKRIINKNSSSENLIKAESKKTEYSKEADVTPIKRVERRVKLIASKTSLKLQMNAIPKRLIIQKPTKSRINNNYNIKDEEYVPIRNFIANKVDKNIITPTKKGFRLVNIAKVIVVGVNAITGSEMSIEQKKDSNGKYVKTEFSSGLLAFSVPVNKKK